MAMAILRVFTNAGRYELTEGQGFRSVRIDDVTNVLEGFVPVNSTALEGSSLTNLGTSFEAATSANLGGNFQKAEYGYYQGHSFVILNTSA